MPTVATAGTTPQNPVGTLHVHTAGSVYVQYSLEGLHECHVSRSRARWDRDLGAHGCRTRQPVTAPPGRMNCVMCHVATPLT